MGQHADVDLTKYREEERLKREASLKTAKIKQQEQELAHAKLVAAQKLEEEIKAQVQTKKEEEYLRHYE